MPQNPRARPWWLGTRWLLILACVAAGGPGASADGGAAPGTDGRPSLSAVRVSPRALKATVSLGGAWQAQGPGPNTLGQVENITDGEVVGAIHTAAAHPTDPDVLYAGAVNGGIWRTADATAASPHWVRQTDLKDSLSIGALAFDPTDATHQTLLAGIGRYSSFGVGGARTGLLRTVDAGATWVALDGGGLLTGKNVSGVAPRGATIVVSVNTADSAALANAGIYRSTDTGATFTQISDGDGSSTGLPGGITHDLASDASDPSRLFTAAVQADTFGGVNGVYRSTDTGATWSKVSDAAIDALITPSTNNVEIAVGPSDTVFVILVNSGQAAGVFRSANGGTSWTAMDLPGTTLFGIHPGGQGSVHLSIVADPGDPDLVYVGGDRQDFPNMIGATDYSGRLFRGDAAAVPGSQWVHLTHSNALGPSGGGTASSSAPHADSREMVFDAAGELIETDDGGIYRRTSPQDNTGDWLSIIGDIQTTELHDASYDANADIVLGGAQDTGTPAQLASNMATWFSVSTADGGDVAVDDISTPGFAVRYSSFQGLAGFRRQVYDAANVFQSQIFPPLTVLGGGSPLVPHFVTPVEVNAVDGTRLIIGGVNSTYESLDQGNTMTEIGPGIGVNGNGRDPVAYGAPGNADLLYVGSGNDVYVRTAAAPAPLVLSAAYPGTDTVSDLALDPDNPSTVFAVDAGAVYRTINAGASWSDVTGDLPTLGPGTLRSIAYVNGSFEDGVVVGAGTGVFAALEVDGFSVWTLLGSELPNAPVFDLDYDSASDLLVAGLLGRGAFKLTPTLVDSSLIFADGFESGNTTAWSATVP